MDVVDREQFDTLVQKFNGLLDLLDQHHGRADGLRNPGDPFHAQGLRAGLEALRIDSQSIPATNIERMNDGI